MRYLRKFNESVDLENMTKSELKSHFMNNFEATRKNIEELADDTKDLSQDELTSIACAMGMTACGLYVSIMKSKYNKTVYI